jgi:septum formation protein
MTTPLPLLLASASPRRRQMLQLLGLPYSVRTPPIDEDAAQERFPGPAEEMAQWLAKHKAAEALKLQEAAGRLVITADTTVLLNGEILGKPRDKAHARQLLFSLRGRWHHVITGIAVSRKIEGRHRIEATSCITPVLMRNYSLAEIDAYIASGDPMDKAGAYGIQHPAFQPTECIDGCYLNVVGLPLCVLVDLLADFKVYPVIAGQRQDDQDIACPWSEKCSI